MDWFAGMVLGHLMGDYVLQNNWMALNKKRMAIPCWTHCFLYTVCVYLSVYPYINNKLINISDNILFVLGIFMSHYVLDRTHLIDRWMKFYGTRSWDSCMPVRVDFEGNVVPDWTDSFTAGETVRTIFGTIIYVVVDNTLHLIMMAIFIKYFFT